MKHLISILAMLLISATFVFCQDRETDPTKWKWALPAQPDHKPLPEPEPPPDNPKAILPTDFIYNKFITGWEWGCNIKTIDIMNSNAEHGHGTDFHLDPTSVPHYSRIRTERVKQMVSSSIFHQGPSSIHYKPTIKIDENDLFKLQKDPDDNSHAFAGFKNIDQATTVQMLN